MPDDALQQMAQARKTLESERARILERLTEIDAALGTNGSARKPQVGEDKIAEVQRFLKGKGWVRQATIAAELNLNPGTVSEALTYLLGQAEVERGSKQDRSTTWRETRPSRRAKT